MGKKLIQIDTIGVIDDTFYLVAVRDNGDSTGSDFRFPLKKTITIGSDATTLTDSFFSNTITEIVALNQTFQQGEDFTQSGTTLAAVSFSFISGKKFIFKL